MLPHFGLLGVIGVGATVGTVNLALSLTTQYADLGVTLVTLLWALASGGLPAMTVLHVSQRMHSRDEYRFSASVPGRLSGRAGGAAVVTTEDLSVRGCSLLSTTNLLPATLTTLTLDLPHRRSRVGWGGV